MRPVFKYYTSAHIVAVEIVIYGFYNYSENLGCIIIMQAGNITILGHRNCQVSGGERAITLKHQKNSHNAHIHAHTHGVIYSTTHTRHGEY